MIDLHSHTSESDGTLSPREIVDTAAGLGLEALAITDHDTFSGFEQAEEYARERGLDLVCGIELSTRLLAGRDPRGKSAHLLAYFLDGPPPGEIRDWVLGLQQTRRERNRKMAACLREHGVDVTLEEVEAIGRSVTGRPHFARVLVDRGYVRSYAEAFSKYLDESAKCYVYREEPATADAVRRVLQAGGLPSLAHPVRLNLHAEQEEQAIKSLVDAGLPAIEVYHSDHTRGHCMHYEDVARRYGLIRTGGSDFHGSNKPAMRLGAGLRNNLSIPKELLDRMRQSSREALRR